jgi:hypothetical protein
MFVRVKRSGSGATAREYLQIVELATLGRRDEIVADGRLDGLLQSLAKFSERLRVVEKVRTEGIQAHAARSWGPALVFERLWQHQGVDELLAGLARHRHFSFSPERVAFALALQRLTEPGSDLQGSSWVRTVECPGFAEIELQHMYRTAGWFSEIRNDLEKSLFLRDRDLFSQTLDLVFIDTTSTFIYRDEETDLRRRGYSRDRMPDYPQVVICLAVDQQGWPIAWDLLPGNTADTVAFVAMIQKLRQRFNIRRVVVVADRGMMGKDAIALLERHEQAPFDFILGCKMRQQKEVTDEVLSRAGRYQKVADNLEVKEVVVGERRYVVCKNPMEAKKDAAARDAIVAKLEQALAHGPKTVIRNIGFKRFIRLEKGSMSIDREAIARDARLDGKFVLRTSTSFDTADVARAYKSLWRVERAFRETKSTLEVRPLFHHRDDTTIGHIVGCFLALRLEVDLQRRLDERGADVAWPDLMRDLGEVKAVDVSLDGKLYRLRTDLRGHASKAFVAAGVRPPPVLTYVGDALPPAPTSEAAGM